MRKQQTVRNSSGKKPTTRKNLKKPLWWSAWLIILSVIYLFPEIIFNSQLVAIAGSQWSSPDQLKMIELFGRSISGIGITLLLADLILQERHVSTPYKAVISLFLLTLIIWPVVFFWSEMAH